MTKKFEKLNIETMVVDPPTLVGKLLQSKNDLMKSNTIIHFHDSDTFYEKFVAGNSNSTAGSLLSQFLKKVIGFTGEFSDSTFFDVTLRGAACLQDVLVDLVRTSHPSDNILQRTLKDDFSPWIDPFAPNTFCVSIERDCYIKPLLEVMSKGSSILKTQLDLGISRCPQIYYVDIVKLDDNNPEVSDASRWIFADIPCGKDAEIGNEFLKFLQQEPAVSELTARIRKEPLFAGVKAFLLKDISATVVFNASYNDCLQEFNKTRESISKWFILPLASIKLDTEAYISSTAAELEYFKKFENEGKLVEVVPKTEAEEREFEIKLLEESRNRVVTDVNRIVSKIDDLNKKLSKNLNVIEEYEANIVTCQDEIKSLNTEYINSVEENNKLNCRINELSIEKAELVNSIDREQEKIDNLKPVIEKLDNLLNTVENEGAKKEEERKRVLARTSELNSMASDVYRKCDGKLEKFTECLNSFKKDAVINKDKTTNAMDISMLEKLNEAASKDVKVFSDFEKEAKKDFPGICSLAENKLNILKDKVNLKDIQISEEIKGISNKFKDDIQKKKKETLDVALNDLSKDIENFKSNLNTNMECGDTVKLCNIFKNIQ